MTHPHSDTVKDQILARLDFWSFYAGELPDLKKSGKEAQALCPFHPDGNASLSVNLDTGLFHCFGCKISGDVFDFVQRRYNLPFKGAMSHLAKIIGVPYSPQEKRRGNPSAELDYLAEYRTRVPGFQALADSLNDKGFMPVKPIYNADRRAFILIKPVEDKQRGRGGSYLEFNGNGGIIFFRSFFDVMADKGGFMTPQEAKSYYDQLAGKVPIKGYDYLAADGSLVYQVCRFETPGKGKTFRQRRPDPEAPGGWSWDMKEVNRIPYRLPEIAKADQVFIAEGEKDCDALAAIGLAATCNSGGAGNWQLELNQHFAGKNVILLPDNDTAGAAHSLQVAYQLFDLAASVKIVNLPDLPPKGDASDWLAAGGTKEKLILFAANIPNWSQPSKEKPAAPQTDQDVLTKEVAAYGYNLTDVGNGRRLVDLFGEDIHYCYPKKSWYVWDSCRWQKDQIGHVESLGKKAVKAIYRQAIEQSDSDARKELMQHAKRSDGERNRSAMLASVRSEPGIPVLPEAFDANQWQLNVANGTIDLRTGELLPHQRANLITRLVPAEYNPEATCEAWENFLYQVFSNDHELVNFVQMAVGYALTGDTREQCFFILYGSGSNGKSTFINTLRAVLGDYALETPVSTLMMKPNGEIPNDLARLDGPRLVTARETEQGKRLAESLVKALTGQDTISARYLYGEFFDFVPRFKLFLSTNHKPIIKGTDMGMWRRIRLIPFLNQYTGSDKDESLPDRLMAELPGILAWAMRGCQVWLEEKKLPIPQSVIEATADYREDMDLLSGFLEERCETAQGFSVQTSALYRVYTNWTQEKNPMSQMSFSLAMSERGFVKKRTTGGKRMWHGIALKQEGGEE